MESSTNILLFAIISAFVSVAGAIVTLLKAKPERNKVESESRKIDAERFSSIADGAESVAAGAKVSNDLLLQRILELDKRIIELDERDIKRESELNEMKFNLESVTSQLIEWKDYAFRLGHQLKSHGLEPVPFKVAIQSHGA